MGLPSCPLAVWISAALSCHPAFDQRIKYQGVSKAQHVRGYLVPGSKLRRAKVGDRGVRLRQPTVLRCSRDSPSGTVLPLDMTKYYKRKGGIFMAKVNKAW